MKRVTISGSKGYTKEVLVGTGAEMKGMTFYYEGLLDQHVQLGPYGDLYIFTHIDWDDIACMGDLETYDLALPQGWFNANHNTPGFETSKYVWCYDGPEYRLSGRAISLSQLLLTVVLPKITRELTRGNEE